MLQPATLKFLRDLKKNNNKPWFDAHRPQYESAKKDFEVFIQEVITKHGKNDPDIKDMLAKNCLFRINRDVRFSKDKSPYKSNMGAYISKGGKKSPYSGYYFHCEPGQSFIGGGIWQPEPDKIKKVRQEIDYNWDEFKKIIGSKKFKSIYEDLSTGDEMSLSKVPQGFEKDNPAAKYLKLKSWVAMRDIKDADLTSKGLLKLTLDTFETLLPLLRFLNRAVED
jgi:uncharacterized protein (TIGR02453 family)